MADETSGAAATQQAPEKTDEGKEKKEEPRKPILPQLDPEVMRTTRLYEALLLLDPGEASRTWDKLVEWVNDLIGDKLGQHVQRVDKWADSRKLAYEIKGLKRGTYMQIWFRSEPSKLGELERTLRLDERVVRYVISHHEEEPPTVGLTAEDMEQAAPSSSRDEK